jgi:hypothetical protein
MPSCLPVVQEAVRAEVLLGTQIIAKTPFVKSFNVQQSRSQASTTFNVTMEVFAGTPFNLGEMLTIRAGTKGNLREIFTGKIESTQVRPSFGKPSYFSLTLSGRGVLSELENKTFSRRLKSTGQGLYCLITGGPTNAVDKFYSPDRTVQVGNQSFVSGSPNPAKEGEHSPLIVHRNSLSESVVGGPIGRIAEKPTGSSDLTGGGEGLGVHDHSDMDKGGPSFGVYSSD